MSEGDRASVRAAEGLVAFALDSRIRRDILRAVQESPGIHWSGLRQRFDRSMGTFSHHTRVLRRAGLVHVVHHGRRDYYYPVGHPRAPPGRCPACGQDAAAPSPSTVDTETRTP